MKRSLAIIAALAAVWFVASLIVPLPPRCEKCEAIMVPHERNEAIWACRCGAMQTSWKR